ncbi:Holliday junction branch migration protein RuvA [Leucobacter coleopterorum]|uniref:Holliday junction branch migration complex subunit RuvA n=1 Tax=Leucobacter coleopterorum TaxID=2714933 RepID=A0ABX6JWC7_9MICO|nr:Holliday junction branch migration protein RuvA [Leucobacter coleopterorum]QIM18543.1 Holliday junction branch migration protein RuvA [Leucobacter coleopterorum]
MIASIHGEVLSAGAGWAVIGVGGIGLRVEIPSGRVAQACTGETLFLHTWLVVREDALTLFGFSTEDELTVFGHLIAVSGVGPRSALGVLSSLTPAEIVRAVANEDAKPFQKVSGIGPKTAKLLTVSLAGKLRELSLADSTIDVSATSDPESVAAEAVRDGLVGLGWGESEAWQAVQDARAAGASVESAALLRAALALLQNARPSGRSSR